MKVEKIYELCLEYIKKVLIEEDGNNSKIPEQSFRKRYDHTNRVLMWTDRILEDETLKNTKIRVKELKLAVIFHDVGYITDDDPNHKHSIYSEQIFRNFSKTLPLTEEEIDFISFLIFHHGNKQALKSGDFPLELIILMEADMLDEEGAMALAWDCLTLGATYPSNYEAAYFKIEKFASHILNTNVMRTPTAILFWKKKQDLVTEFMKQLKFDLGL